MRNTRSSSWSAGATCRPEMRGSRRSSARESEGGSIISTNPPNTIEWGYQRMDSIDIRPLTGLPDTVEQLAKLLVKTVAAGGSVSFMHPLAPEMAAAFWSNSLASAERGERVVLGAFEGEALVATVTLLLDFPPNQPHRAEIAKMMTSLSHRG